MAKPADSPDFFRLPAPEGRSRESTIRLDAEGHFWHEGLLVEHRKLASAMHSWIARHPDDGRYILTNGYDWTYFTVEDAPFTVRSLVIENETPLLILSDGSTEPWDPTATRIGKEGALYTNVKKGVQNQKGRQEGNRTSGDPFEAKFTRHAQTELAPLLVEMAGEPGALGAKIRGTVVRIG